MRRLITKALAAFGLASASRCASLLRRVEALDRKSQDWKKRAMKATRRIERLEKEISHHARLLKKAKEDGNRTRASHKQESAEWEDLQRRLTNAERALALARDQLAALEVKLDILEGAANVLDTRTRTLRQQQPGPTTGAAV